MDFLDPIKARRHKIGLKISYGLVAIAIIFASIVLLYQTDGYCINRSGDVNRCGLIFVTSQPSGASIYLDDVLQKSRTNAKLNLESGEYALRVTKEGYRPWQRVIESMGGAVRRYDYIFMFPSQLQTETVDTFTNELSIASQSPDKRWLLTAQADTSATFTVYDMRRSASISSTNIAIPATAYTVNESGAEKWSVVEWSRDNTHVLLKHTYNTKDAAAHEYIVFDREDGAKSQNVTTSLGLSATDVPSLFDQRSDEFYIYNTAEKTLRTSGLNGTDTALILQDVQSYKTLASDTVLYVTDTPPDGKVTAGKVSVVLLQGNRSQVIRQFDAGADSYLLDMAEYSGAWYVVIGSSSEDGVRIYEDPLDQPLATPTSLPAPLRFLRVTDVSSVSFSTNARFIMAENGTQFAVYDSEYNDTYTYSVTQKIDSVIGRATWMDGHRFYYVSNGNVVVRDYDNQNVQTLQPASNKFSLFFSSDYSRVFAVVDDESAATLTGTDLRVQ